MSFGRDHVPNPVREQWERCERWHARLREVANGDFDDAEDYALVVMHHCWTMHDWLIRGLHSPQPVAQHENTYRQADVERLFQAPELRVCRMFSTVAKHLRADKIAMGDYDGVIVREYDWATGGANLTALAHGQHDLLDLCGKAMARIRSFLEDHGWSRPPTQEGSAGRAPPL